MTRERKHNREPVYQLPPFTVHKRLMAAEVGGLTWPVTDYGIDKIWPLCQSGSGVRVGIADTGVSAYHAETGDLRDSVVQAKDFSNSRSGWEDKNGHGSHTAGIVSANDDQKEMAGVAPLAKLYIAKVLNDSGSGGDRQVAEGIAWLAAQGVSIISLSLGSPWPSERIYGAVREASQAGIAVVCAAGNSGRNNDVGYPARYDEVLSVAAIDRARKLAGFSSRGPQNDTSGPGVEILSTYSGNGYAVLSGTSMATPWVSGMLALRHAREMKVWGEIRTKTVEQLIAVLEATSIDLGPDGRDAGYGFGVFDAARLMSLQDDDDGDDDDDDDDDDDGDDDGEDGSGGIPDNAEVVITGRIKRA